MPIGQQVSTSEDIELLRRIIPAVGEDVDVNEDVNVDGALPYDKQCVMEELYSSPTHY